MTVKQNNYSYPIDPDWTNKEISEVVGMFRIVEDAYEVGVNRQTVIEQYKKFKQVANSKAYEKQLGKRFEDVSGYSLYKVMQMTKKNQAGEIGVNGDVK
ncbi:UPF0223 family protein [Limosilactobacillus fastidiosus]|uniref:UPF0223 family protein n=1 Tax=Limosilactobacillus fastidiosus TaxID=2759855 RepID=A0ABR6E6B2_9LACO|nr:UPF0223 family protein [Limosilactobacillus fastidiosus]MBB1062329.1 UPF0223 family protein [Limosilactobacillus fastidiosus]MCD7083406.1 UPF0223 family protein [Limosilactobacillus fastidiosus]